MEGPIVVGIDIGGTKIAAAAVNAHGEIQSREHIPTQAERGFDDGLRRIAALIDRVLGKAHGSRDSLSAIGIGCSGPVDPVRGTIDNPYTLPTWDGVNIVAPLRAEFGVPVVLENDADVAAMGEVWLGAGRGGRIVVMVTIGTGIGGGIILDGKIYRGVGGAHPEIGHHGIDPAGPECYCGIRGCWESLASGPAMVAAVRDQATDRSPGSLTGAQVVADARAGSPVAQAAVARAVEATALGIFNLTNLYTPEIIVLGGGVMDAYDLFEPAIRQTVERNTMAPVERVSIRKAELGNDAGVIGAARLALNAREQH
jgi:glucokinase